jgi:hypothetical protein
LNAYEDELQKMVLKNGLKAKKSSKKVDKGSQQSGDDTNEQEKNIKRNKVVVGRYIHQNKSKVISQ